MLERMVQERVKANRNKQPGTSDSVHGKQPEKSDTQGGGGTELASGQDNPPLPVLERREYGRQSEQTTGEGQGGEEELAQGGGERYFWYRKNR